MRREKGVKLNNRTQQQQALERKRKDLKPVEDPLSNRRVFA